MTSSPIPRIHLLCIADKYITAFKEAAQTRGLPSSVDIEFHSHTLSALPSSVQFDAIVSPANSHGILDGGFDDAISKAFSPVDDYSALTHVVQGKLYDECRGFAPPGTCTLVRIYPDFESFSNNRWGTKFLALCPTMRIPQDVRWDREVIYEAIWSLLCAVDKHNRTAAASGGDGREETKIESLLMTPLATGTGIGSAERWAAQTVLAIKHFVEALEKPVQWQRIRWQRATELAIEVQRTWPL